MDVMAVRLATCSAMVIVIECVTGFPIGCQREGPVSVRHRGSMSEAISLLYPLVLHSMKKAASRLIRGSVLLVLPHRRSHISLYLHLLIRLVVRHTVSASDTMGKRIAGYFLYLIDTCDVWC